MVSWKVHWWILGITGVPCLALVAFMLFSALTDTSEMAIGVFIYGALLGVVWGAFAGGATALFAWLRRYGAAAVAVGYVVAILPIVLVCFRILR